MLMKVHTAPINFCAHLPNTAQNVDVSIFSSVIDDALCFTCLTVAGYIISLYRIPTGLSTDVLRHSVLSGRVFFFWGEDDKMKLHTAEIPIFYVRRNIEMRHKSIYRKQDRNAFRQTASETALLNFEIRSLRNEMQIRSPFIPLRKFSYYISNLNKRK